MLEPVNSMVTWCFLFEPKPNQYKTENVFGPFLSTVCILVIKAGIQIFDYIQIKIKMSNSSQEPPASSKTWMFLANFKIKRGDQNLGPGCIKDQWPYTNQDNDTKLQSGTSRLHRPPKSQLGTYRTWMFFAPSKSI